MSPAGRSVAFFDVISIRVFVQAMTTKPDTPAGRQRPFLGVAAAVTLLIASGVAYRMASAYLSPDDTASSLPPGTLAGIPMRLGDWVGRDTPLAEEIIQVTDTDDHVSRVYSGPGPDKSVSLFVGYGVRLRDLVPHRPEVCYKGAGWTLEHQKTETLALDDPGAEPLQSRILRFRRGGLSSKRMTVLNYFIVDGLYCPDVSLLRSRAWRKNASRYVAQVQVACEGRTIRDRCEESAKAFAAASAEAIRSCLVEGVQRAAGSFAAASETG